MTIRVGSNLSVFVDGAIGEEHYNALMKLLRAIDTLVQAHVISATVSVPPTTATNGDCYLVPDGATGAWATHVGAIARYVSGRNTEDDPTWEYFAPKKGWVIHVDDDTTGGSASGNLVKYNGLTWDNMSTAGLLINPTLSGIPTAPTAAKGNSSLQVANTAFVAGAIADLVDSSPELLNTLSEFAAAINNDPSFAATMIAQLALKAPIASPAFTGEPTAPTPPPGDSSTRVATTEHVAQAFGVFNGGMVTASFVATEAIPAGSLVNLYSNDGTFSVRNARANVVGKEAHGYLLTPVVNGGTAVVFFAGMNDKMSGLTVGVQYLSPVTPGACSTSPPSTVGQIYQQVGIAISETSLLFSFNIPLQLT